MPSHNPKFLIELRSIVTNPRGDILTCSPWEPANSLIKQFIQLLTVLMSGITTSITDTSGTNQNVGLDPSNLKCNAIANQDLYGILIGTGTTAVTMADYKLETQVKTSITHASQTFAVENPDANTWRLATSRGLTNNTGSVVHVKEVALYTHYATGWNFCIDRTLYPVDIPTGATLTLTYRLTVTL